MPQEKLRGFQCVALHCENSSPEQRSRLTKERNAELRKVCIRSEATGDAVEIVEALLTACPELRVRASSLHTQRLVASPQDLGEGEGERAYLESPMTAG